MGRIDTGILILFGARVQELRQIRDLSQGQLAAKLEVHRPYLSGIECGNRCPSLKTISKIAMSLDVDVWDLLKNGRPPTEPRRVFKEPASQRRKLPVNVRFGRNVQTLRGERGWSVHQLAMKSGFRRSYVEGLERGARNPSLLRMAQIAKALDVTIAVCFE